MTGERYDPFLDDEFCGAFRYFGVEVLELVAPPYSKQFVDAFLPVVANTEVFDRATLEKHPTAKEFLSAF